MRDLFFKMPNILTYIGLMSLVHSAFLAAQASSAKISLHIIIQVLASMLLTMAGMVMNTKLIDIKYTGHKNYDTIVNRPSLYTFNHRGRFVYPRTAKL